MADHLFLAIAVVFQVVAAALLFEGAKTMSTQSDRFVANLSALEASNAKLKGLVQTLVDAASTSGTASETILSDAADKLADDAADIDQFVAANTPQAGA